MLRLLLATPLLLALGAPFAAALDVGPASVTVDAPVVASPVDPPVALPAPESPLVPSGLARAPAPLPLPLPAPAPGAPALPVGFDITGRASTPSAAPSPSPAIEAPPATLTAAAGSTLLWLLLERFGFGRALAPLYSRLAPSQLLDNERRERILALVRARPGIGPQDVGQSLGTSWGVTQYHLDKLEKAGLVTSQRIGQHRCYFLPGAIPREQQVTVGMMRVETTRRLAQLVAQKPGLTQTQLCAELGISASAMSKQVARLETAGVLRREAGAGAAKLYPAADALRA